MGYVKIRAPNALVSVHPATESSLRIHTHTKPLLASPAFDLIDRIRHKTRPRCAHVREFERVLARMLERKPKSLISSENWRLAQLKHALSVEATEAGLN